LFFVVNEGRNDQQIYNNNNNNNNDDDDDDNNNNYVSWGNSTRHGDFSGPSKEN